MSTGFSHFNTLFEEIPCVLSWQVNEDAHLVTFLTVSLVSFRILRLTGTKDAGYPRWMLLSRRGRTKNVKYCREWMPSLL